MKRSFRSWLVLAAGCCLVLGCTNIDAVRVGVTGGVSRGFERAIGGVVQGIIEGFLMGN